MTCAPFQRRAGHDHDEAGGQGVDCAGVLAAPLLPALGVGVGTVEGEDAVPEAPEVGVPEVGVGVPEVCDADDVGLAGVDPVGVTDGVLDGCVVCRCCCRVAWPTGLLSGGLPTASWNATMPAMTTMKSPAAMPP
jgi:hypothetical protein